MCFYADKFSQKLRQVDMYGIQEGWRRKPTTGIPSR